MMDDRSYSRHDDFLKVVEDTVPVLWLCRRSFCDKILHVSRLHVWNHPPLPDREQVLGDVVHQLLTCISNRQCHSRWHSTPVNHVKQSAWLPLRLYSPACILSRWKPLRVVRCLQQMAEGYLEREVSKLYRVSRQEHTLDTVTQAGGLFFYCCKWIDICCLPFW